MTPQRSAQIDFWRGFSAVAVALLHVRENLWIGMSDYVAQGRVGFDMSSLLAFMLAPAAYGSMGVAFFFVLSGFCIHKAHGRAMARDAGYRLDLGEFAWKRAARIYPPFLAALVLTLALGNISRAFLPNHPKLGDDSLASLLINAATLQNIVGPPFGSNGALWSLSIEIHLYLAYPALFALRRRLGATKFMAAIGVVNAISLPVTAQLKIDLFTNYLVVWWVGALISEIDRRPSKLWLPVGLVAIAVGLAIIKAHPMAAFQFCGVGFAALFTGSEALNWLGWWGRPIVAVGRFSYSLYLVHLPVAVLISAVVFHGIKQSLVYATLGGAVAALTAAWCFYLLFEKNSIALAHSRTRLHAAYFGKRS